MQPDSLRAGRRADSAGRLNEGAEQAVDYSSMGAIPKRTEAEQPFLLNTKITEPEAAATSATPASLSAIPETPDPFGLQVRLGRKSVSSTTKLPATR